MCLFRYVYRHRDRTIALFRSSDTYVVQSRSWLPHAVGGVIWFGPHAAHGTVYNPIMMAMNRSPDCLAYGWQGVYNTTSSFWANRNVLNLAQMKFDYIIKDVKSKQLELEGVGQALVDDLSAKYGPLNDLNTADQVAITDALANHAEANRLAYVQLFNLVLFTYADGFFNSWKNDQFSSVSLGNYHYLNIPFLLSLRFLLILPFQMLGYPAWWLEDVGYPDGPPPVTGQRQEAMGFPTYKKQIQANAAEVAAQQ